MDALTLLMSQHEEVNALFEELEDTDDEDDKLALFTELSNSFAAHAAIEEKIFYPAAYANATAGLLGEALEEHMAAKRTIAELLTMSPGDEQFDAKVKILKQQIEHHVEEEEGKLFPRVKKELEAKELEALGAELEEMFEAELEKGPGDEGDEVTTEFKAPPAKAKGAKPEPKGPKRGKRQPARQ